MFTTANLSYTDTTLGGNWAVNPPPQFTRNADIRYGGVIGNYRGRDASGGVGRAYFENIDQNAQLLHMQFGVTEFNGMVTFFTGFYNTEAGIIARTGRTPSFIYRIGQVGGYVIGFRAFAIIGLMHLLRFLVDKPSSKYCYMKPAMMMYWNRVNFILNAFAVEMGIVKPLFQGGEFGEEKMWGWDMDTKGEIPQYTDEDRATMHRDWDDIFRKDGTIDVYSVSSRAQRLAIKEREMVEAMAEEETNIEAFIERMNRYRHDPDVEASEGHDFADDRGRTFEQALKDWYSSPQGVEPTDAATSTELVEKTGRTEVHFDKKAINPKTGEPGVFKRTLNWLGDSTKNAQAQLSAELNDGSQFVAFNVQHLGTVTDTFSNTVGESSIKEQINGWSSSARTARFSFSDGNTGIPIFDGIVKGAKDLAMGFADGIGMTGLLSLFGSSFVDMPQEWKTSNAQLDTATYTMSLRSPYGDPMARLMYLYYPLACILAGAIPLSTGKASYTSPFTCFWYHQGFSNCRYGMITNLSVTSGVGSAGWTRNNEPLGFDVTFTLTSLSSIVHAPVQPTYSKINPFSGVTENDDVFMDYVARLSGRSFENTFYQSRRLLMNLNKKWTDTSSFFTVSHFTQWAASSTPARIVSGIFYPPSDRAE